MRALVATMALKGIRFLVSMVFFALATALVFVASMPELDRSAAVLGAVGVALLISLYDLGLFRGELSI